MQMQMTSISPEVFQADRQLTARPDTEPFGILQPNRFCGFLGKRSQPRKSLSIVMLNSAFPVVLSDPQPVPNSQDMFWFNRGFLPADAGG